MTTPASSRPLTPLTPSKTWYYSPYLVPELKSVDGQADALAGERDQLGSRRLEEDKQHVLPQLALKIKISQQVEGVLAQERDRLCRVLAGANPFLREEWS